MTTTITLARLHDLRLVNAKLKLPKSAKVKFPTCG